MGEGAQADTNTKASSEYAPRPMHCFVIPQLIGIIYPIRRDIPEYFSLGIRISAPLS